jgi:hypothetical protein
MLSVSDEAYINGMRNQSIINTSIETTPARFTVAWRGKTALVK